ncbi:MAG TPA: CRTAC1 family protein, partial [Candidatus Saccharimonadales bacterium]|nr:CRTAC1 family protein [Candidatus Saccharimonadales bacterium]
MALCGVAAPGRLGWAGAAPGAGSLSWEAGPGYRRARLAVPANGRTGFTLLTPPQTGIWFTNLLSYPRSLTNQNLLNGAGVCAGDFDGDGLPDLYFCNLEGRNGLFRNLGGWKFEDVTTVWGAGCEHLVSRGAAFADVNGDGRLDLLVTSLFGPNALLLNEGQGRFRDATEEAGLTLLRMGCESLALGDLNGDGSLDLYIANNGENSILRSGGSVSVRKVNGRDQVTGRAAQRLKIVNGQLIESGPGDALYFNDGKGHFTRVPWTEGAFLDESGQPLSEAPRDLGLAVAFRDLNGDGAPDIYVCNDFQTPDRIWINDGHGKFRALPDLAMRTTSHFSMCVDFADIDRDGRDDLFVNDMLSHLHRLRMTQTGATNPPAAELGAVIDRQQARRNTLQWNRGDGTYAEIANYAGVEASDWTWSVAFLDVDLDGYEDLLTVNGHAYDTQDLDVAERVPLPGAAGGLRGKMLSSYPPLLTPNYLFRNRGDRTFEEVGAAWGFDSTNVSHGLSLVDLDNDGDLDVVVSCLWQPPLLYRNDSSHPRVAVRLKGLAPNTQGIGARISVRGAMPVTQTQEMQCGGRYLASDQAMRTFAVATLTNRFSIEVRWRSGRTSLIPSAEANCLYEIDEAAAAQSPRQPPESSTRVLFEDVSERLGHVHQDPPFNDLERQPLLPKLLSRLGPGVAWSDLEGDGRDELIVGAGRGTALAVFTPDGKGGFRRMADPLWQSPVPDDATGLAGWTPAPGVRSLLVGVSGYETAGSSAPAVLRYDSPSSSPQPA